MKQESITIMVSKEQKKEFKLYIMKKGIEEGKLYTTSSFIREKLIEPSLNGANPAHNQDSKEDSIKESSPPVSSKDKTDVFDFGDMEL